MVESSPVTQLVCEHLARHGGLTPDERNWLVNWWQQAMPGQGLAEFLVANGILDRSCLQSLQMVCKGFLRSDAMSGYFGPNVVSQLRMQRRSQNEEMTNARSTSFETNRRLGTTTVPDISHAMVTEELRERQKSKTASVGSNTDIVRRSQLGIRKSSSDSIVDVTARNRETPSQYDRGSRITSQGPIKIGSVLGKCALTEQIGKGGAGVVFRAIHQTLNITVAVKVIKNRNSNVDKAELEMEQLRTEARILAQMNHPHVIRIFDFEEKPEPFLVLEYVEGFSMAELIEHAGMIRFDRALTMIKQAALALQAAQHAGIIHRDIKPANLLVSRAGVTKLADLGLAVMRHTSQESIYGDSPVGTLAYMPPEQATSSKADFRSDIYSLGATFYHAITGRTLFPCRNFGEAMMQLITGTPIPPKDLMPNLDPVANDVIMRMTAKDPEARFSNYQELIDAFDDLLERQNQPQPNRKTNADIKIDTATQRFNIRPASESQHE